MRDILADFFMEVEEETERHRDKGTKLGRSFRIKIYTCFSLLISADIILSISRLFSNKAINDVSEV